MYTTDLLPMISLFTGAGGLDLGLEKLGFTTKVAIEIDKWAQATLDGNRKFFRDPEFNLLTDITKYSPYEILEISGLKRGEAALIAGGPPCQSFSTAGRRGSFQDPRGTLFANFAATVAAVRPRFFVMENVRGLLSASIKHRPLNQRNSENPPLSLEEQPGSAFQVIRDEFENILNYQITCGLVDAADYGVPQNRLRVIVLGSRDHEFQTADLREIMSPVFRGQWRSLREGLKNLKQEPPKFIPYSRDREEIMRLVPPGMNWRWFRDHPEYGPSFASNLMGGAWQADGGKVGFFRRLTWDKPSPTLPTSPIQKSTFLCHPDETRPLSVQEYAAIQQFPEDYVFAGGLSQQYKQIGNAVPVGLGFAVGRGILETMHQIVPDAQRRLLETSV